MDVLSMFPLLDKMRMFWKLIGVPKLFNVYLSSGILCLTHPLAYPLPAPISMKTAWPPKKIEWSEPMLPIPKGLLADSTWHIKHWYDNKPWLWLWLRRFPKPFPYTIRKLAMHRPATSHSVSSTGACLGLLHGKTMRLHQPPTTTPRPTLRTRTQTMISTNYSIFGKKGISCWVCNCCVVSAWCRVSF
ncbi:hypothetical protein BDN70DRAFT_495276 [Pholiota conissans]|uniref:Uncharacterized protein n=1 Tax=Pholiota conissans TaxID=109636 RepID=A0A9P5YNI0_9AGAR|nr:hypothetical protein BDN70DRAFT_495276 [Pholiota conissans]